jgi:hypothetical protein
VVIDTPGLNAIGAEPELTLGLLPSAHATVFILGADTGVTKSDLEIWREHLDGRALERFVVLNKIDTLIDPLISREEVQEQVRHQCDVVAQTLAIERARVFPLSARDALAARVAGDEAGVQTSRLPALEEALSAQLMPQRAAVIGRIAIDGMEALRQQAAKRLGDQRRQLTEQLLELRGLRGKSGSKVKLMLERAQADSAEFERCTVRLSALKAVHARQLKQVMQLLSSDRVRDEVTQMRKTSDASWFKLGARKAFLGLCERLRSMMSQATQRVGEIEQMLTGHLQAAQRRIRLCAGGGADAEHGALRARARTDRIELHALPRRRQRVASVGAGLPRSLPAHVGVQAARRVRERRWGHRDVEPLHGGANGVAAARPAARFQAPP